MNERIELKLGLLTIYFFIVLSMIVIYFFCGFFGWDKKGDVFLNLFIIIAIMVHGKFLYLSSVTRLIMEKDIIEFKLPFRKSKIVTLINISEIKKTGAWTRNEKYYLVKYNGGSFNTYFMSTENMKQVSKFISELQQRVDKAKKEIAN